jgi:hypothetical protein
LAVTTTAVSMPYQLRLREPRPPDLVDAVSGVLSLKAMAGLTGQVWQLG